MLMIPDESRVTLTGAVRPAALSDPLVVGSARWVTHTSRPPVATITTISRINRRLSRRPRMRTSPSRFEMAGCRDGQCAVPGPPLPVRLARSAGQSKAQAGCPRGPRDRVAEDEVGQPDTQVADQDPTLGRPLYALPQGEADRRVGIGIGVEQAGRAVRVELATFVDQEQAGSKGNLVVDAGGVVHGDHQRIRRQVRTA